MDACLREGGVCSVMRGRLRTGRREHRRGVCEDEALPLASSQVLFKTQRSCPGGFLRGRGHLLGSGLSLWLCMVLRW